MSLYEPSIPLPGVYGQQQVLAKKAYDDAIRQINEKRNQTLTQFGMKASAFDENGNVTSYEVDPTSQYGGYQSLLRGQGSALDAQRQSFLSRGVRGGLANQAELLARQDMGQQEEQFRNQLTTSFSDLAKARMDAETGYNQTILGIEQGAAQEAIQNRLFTPADVPDDQTVDVPGPSQQWETPTTQTMADTQVDVARAIAYATQMLQRAKAAGVNVGSIGNDPRASGA